jgi:hypothetical protein
MPGNKVMSVKLGNRYRSILSVLPYESMMSPIQATSFNMLEESDGLPIWGKRFAKD